MKYIKLIPFIFSLILLCYFVLKNINIINDIRYVVHIYLYLTILILISLFSFVFIFLNKNIRMNISLVFVSTLIPLYLFEGYLVIKSKKMNENIYAYEDEFQTEENVRMLAIAVEMGDRYTVFKKYKELGIDLVLTFPPTTLLTKKLDIFPLSGISNSFTYFGNENAYNLFYWSDDHGFFNKNTDWEKKIDYLIVGDSHAHGCCVKEEENIKGQLEILSKYKKNILNLAYSGNGSLIQYATLREYIEYTKPKHILWIYSEQNDKDDTVRELKNEILKKYLNDENFTQNLFYKSKERDLFLRNLFENEFINNKKSLEELEQLITADTINQNVEIENSKEKINKIQLELQQKIKKLNQEIETTKKNNEILSKSQKENVIEKQLLTKEYKSLFNKNMKLIEEKSMLEKKVGEFLHIGDWTPDADEFIDEWGRNWGDKQSNIHFLRNFIKLFNFRNLIEKLFIKDYAIKNFEKIMQKTKKLAEAHNAKLTFVYLPTIHRYSIYNNIENIMESNSIINIVKSLGINLIDIRVVIKENYKDPLSLFPFRRRVHYNAEGFKLIANTILNKQSNN